MCLIDEFNRLLILDREHLQPINGVYHGRKITMAGSETYIYVQNDRFISLYRWNLDLIEKVGIQNYQQTQI